MGLCRRLFLVPQLTASRWSPTRNPQAQLGYRLSPACFLYANQTICMIKAFKTRMDSSLAQSKRKWQKRRSFLHKNRCCQCEKYAGEYREKLMVIL